MKLRIKGNSLRLRLGRSEVEQLASAGEVFERVDFGRGATLEYRLQTDDVGEVTAELAGCVIAVKIPRKMALDWTTGDEVGIEGTLDNGTGDPLRILIEKDFACLTAREGEDERDSYPHPAEGTAC